MAARFKCPTRTTLSVHNIEQLSVEASPENGGAITPNTGGEARTCVTEPLCGPVVSCVCRERIAYRLRASALIGWSKIRQRAERAFGGEGDRLGQRGMRMNAQRNILQCCPHLNGQHQLLKGNLGLQLDIF